MLVGQMLDQYSLGWLFLFTVAIMLMLFEIGFRLGRRHKNQAKAQHSQVRAIMGACLGLLAFMLAFTFANAQSHFEARVQNMVDEARLASNAFLRAEFLSEPYRSQARGILRDYIGGRLEMRRLIYEDRLPDALVLFNESEELQQKLWDIAVFNDLETRDPSDRSAQQDPFMMAVIGLIDIHAMRLQTAYMNRISWAIWATLMFTGLLSMLIMGYQAALVGRRSPIASVTLTVAFAAVMMLIIDLDRPIMSLFQINDQIMVDLAERMDVML